MSQRDKQVIAQLDNYLAPLGENPTFNIFDGELPSPPQSYNLAANVLGLQGFLDRQQELDASGLSTSAITDIDTIVSEYKTK